jgi:hypothetical protein
VELIVHGLPDKFVDHGTPDELYSDLKMDVKGVSEIMKDLLLQKEKIIF